MLFERYFTEIWVGFDEIICDDSGEKYNPGYKAICKCQSQDTLCI